MFRAIGPTTRRARRSSTVRRATGLGVSDEAERAPHARPLGTLLGFKSGRPVPDRQGVSIAVLTNQSRDRSTGHHEGPVAARRARRPSRRRSGDGLRDAVGTVPRRLRTARGRSLTGATCTTNASAPDHGQPARYGRVWTGRAGARRGRHRSHGGRVPIRVDAYTAGGMASGLLARSGHLRDALETASSCPLEARGVARPRRGPPQRHRRCHDPGRRRPDRR
jgi:hypothetical protein